MEWLAVEHGQYSQTIGYIDFFLIIYPKQVTKTQVVAERERIAFKESRQ